MKKAPPLLDKITDTVISYRPARKTAAAKKQKSISAGSKKKAPARKGDNHVQS